MMTYITLIFIYMVNEMGLIIHMSEFYNSRE